MIPLEETTFEFEEIRDNIIGAGILPVSVDSAGVVRMLLGKERYINHWRGSLKWSGFEGGRKPGEEIETTAAREFIEESIACLALDDDRRPTIRGVVEYLKSEKYVARIVLCIVHGEQSERRYHVTYVVQVPYQRDCPSSFLQRRKVIVEMQGKYNTHLKLNDTILSTTNLPHEGRADEDIAALTRVEDRNGVLHVEYIDSDENRHVHEHAELSPELRSSYLRWFELRNALTRDCNIFETECEGALTAQRNAVNVVVSIKFNEDFIEKQIVQWWPTSDLKRVIQNGGYVNSDFFRAYFLPVMQRALAEIVPAARFPARPVEDLFANMSVREKHVCT